MRVLTSITLTLIAFALSATSFADESSTTYELDIEAQALPGALKSFAEQTELQVVYFAAVAEGKDAPAVAGEFTADAALDQLLADAGLKYKNVDERTYSIAPEPEATPERGASDSKNLTPTPVMMAQNQTSPSPTSGGSEGNTEEDVVTEILEEIIVLGSNIRGGAPVGAPILNFDRDFIERSGFSTTQEFVESIPQNSGAGASEDAIFGVDALNNFTGGAAVNLRGLGTDSTLVLVNGRRTVQAGGFDGGFVDISSIPLTAIERIEVLSDGASAVYGSDAIAGVVNFVLRDDFDGAETTARYGTVTDGDLEEFRFAQTFGKSWTTGNVLLAYEYFDRDPLPRTARDYLSSDLTPFGGEDFGLVFSSPANITRVTLADGTRVPVVAAVPSGQDGTNLSANDLLIDVVNLQDQAEGRDWTRGQERHSVFVLAEQELSDRVNIFGELRYSNRDFEHRLGGSIRRNETVPDVNPFFVSPIAGATEVQIQYNMLDTFGPSIRTGEVENITGVLGLTADIGRTWQAEVYGTSSEETSTREIRNGVDASSFRAALRSPDPSTAFNPFGDGPNNPQALVDSLKRRTLNEFGGDLTSINAKVDGTLLSISGGDIKAAFGGEFRREGFDRKPAQIFVGGVFDSEATSNAVIAEREVFAAFGEVLIPLVGASNARTGIARLDLSVAARYEDYDDFGSTTNPRIGITWSPIVDLDLRASYGTSFRAPRLTEINGSQAAFPFTVSDPVAPDGTSFALLLSGANPNLTPEESTSWTGGFDFKPRRVPGLSISGTYFTIDFDGRIAAPQPSQFTIASQPELFESLLDRDPDDQLVQSIIDGPWFLSFFGTPNAADIELIVDGRLANISTTEVSGIDLNASYLVDTESGLFDIGLNATNLLEFKEALTSTAPVIDNVDVINKIVDLKLRGNVGWTHNEWSFSAFINYVGSYRDNTNDPERNVDAWTTVDTQIRYSIDDDRSGPLSGVTASINVQNVFDEDPPFVNNRSGIGFDPNVANALGRFVSFEIRKSW